MHNVENQNQLMSTQKPIIPQQFTAVLEDKQIYNDKFVHYSFELVKPHRIEFRSGQYISLQVAEDGSRRAYSIISTSDVDHGVEILLEPVEGGLGTSYLEKLNFGDKVNFLAPMGMFTIPDGEQDGCLTFIATGSGIAPTRSMIYDQLQNKQDKREMTLYWGLRYTDHLIWEHDFLDMTENFPNFHFHPVISRATEEWSLCRGRVTDCLSIHELPKNCEYYLCGSSKMVEDTKKILSDRKVEESKIHHEKFDL
jgi:Na+-transporting NADH:ubiquinone oxidoreductase subunit F